jgi:hypothetical protein
VTDSLADRSRHGRMARCAASLAMAPVSAMSRWRCSHLSTNHAGPSFRASRPSRRTRVVAAVKGTEHGRRRRCHRNALGHVGPAAPTSEALPGFSSAAIPAAAEGLDPGPQGGAVLPDDPRILPGVRAQSRGALSQPRRSRRRNAARSPAWARPLSPQAPRRGKADPAQSRVWKRGAHAAESDR